MKRKSFHVHSVSMANQVVAKVKICERASTTRDGALLKMTIAREYIAKFGKHKANFLLLYNNSNYEVSHSLLHAQTTFFQNNRHLTHTLPPFRKFLTQLSHRWILFRFSLLLSLQVSHCSVCVANRPSHRAFLQGFSSFSS
ncbi:unnamed protein product [Albugo candida]|uniref:Uncharacterized protein n=1 Tax=Albugo candida TaxID=65357 RepID=A0A024FT76_9STRA|nr:unnamed protein product [Albugo candida]|eukprot:CCI10293.1 unnamed protein product [Albugo candida]